jgi:hypothetical protein
MYSPPPLLDTYTEERLPVVAEVREAHSAYDVEAGDRAPDAPGLFKVSLENQKSGESTRLFKLLSPTHHTVLIFCRGS